LAKSKVAKKIEWIERIDNIDNIEQVEEIDGDRGLQEAETRRRLRGIETTDGEGFTKDGRPEGLTNS